MTDFQQFFWPSLSTSTAGYVGYVSQLLQGIDQMQTNVGPSSAVLAQHHADSAQRLVFAIIRAVWCWPM